MTEITWKWRENDSFTSKNQNFEDLGELTWNYPGIKVELVEQMQFYQQKSTFSGFKGINLELTWN